MSKIDNLILQVQNGSKLYGTDTPQSDDDYLGIFVEKPKYLFGGNEAKTKNFHDRDPEAPSQEGEVDGVAYTLRHFFKLALQGNPSILCVLFAKPEHIVNSTPEGLLILENKELFISAKAGPKFLGYMNSQLLRLRGEKKGHIPSRKEIREKYGYDTKYAMQIARLALQGMEFLREGTITLPMSEGDRIVLSDIRNGAFTYEEILDILGEYDLQLKELVDGKPYLKQEPDTKAVYQLSREIHERTWNASN